ncbi:hypothetical protein [Hydrogenimonas sp.]
MQRNFTHQKTLTLFAALLGLLLLYPTMASLYPLLPPLLGIVYVKWRDALYRRDYFWVMAWMLYAVIFESVWNLPLYGIWALMIVTFTIFDPKISHLIHSDWLLGVLGAVLFDGLYLLFLLGYGAVMHTQPVEVDLIFLYYLLADVVGVLLF